MEWQDDILINDNINHDCGLNDETILDLTLNLLVLSLEGFFYPNKWRHKKKIGIQQYISDHKAFASKHDKRELSVI